MKTIRICLLLTAMSVLGDPAAAQLVLPEVSIDVQRLPDEAQQKLAGLDSLIAQYFSNSAQPWNRDDFGYDVPIQINVYFTEYTANPQEDKYKANLIITNKKEARYDDKRWEFGLRTPVTPVQGQFHPFFAVMEFYVWMLIGVEEDKQEKLGGRPFFDKARQVFLQSSQSIYYFGWDKRSDLLRDYMDDANQTFRELNFYYYTGIYFDATGDVQNSGEYLFWAMLKLKDVSITQQHDFLASNHVDLAAALGRAQIPPEKLLALKNSLLRMDPANQSVYETIPVPSKDE